VRQPGPSRHQRKHRQQDTRAAADLAQQIGIRVSCGHLRADPDKQGQAHGQSNKPPPPGCLLGGVAIAAIGVLGTLQLVSADRPLHRCQSHCQHGDAEELPDLQAQHGVGDLGGQLQPHHQHHNQDCRRPQQPHGRRGRMPVRVDVADRQQQQLNDDPRRQQPLDDGHRHQHPAEGAHPVARVNRHAAHPRPVLPEHPGRQEILQHIDGCQRDQGQVGDAQPPPEQRRIQLCLLIGCLHRRWVGGPDQLRCSADRLWCRRFLAGVPPGPTQQHDRPGQQVAGHEHQRVQQQAHQAERQRRPVVSCRVSVGEVAPALDHRGDVLRGPKQPGLQTRGHIARCVHGLQQRAEGGDSGDRGQDHQRRRSKDPWGHTAGGQLLANPKASSHQPCHQEPPSQNGQRHQPRPNRTGRPEPIVFGLAG
jgi:hypothetical protein